ncbi:MAG: hypothetical protein NUW09_11500 [Deltaproteobacteria bacterium]|nr:hypothetical protein [Deltaproteobacteria bacterium]
MVRVINKDGKYDYVKRTLLKFYIQKGYVVAEVDNHKNHRKGSESVEHERILLEDEFYLEGIKALRYVPFFEAGVKKEAVV